MSAPDGLMRLLVGGGGLLGLAGVGISAAAAHRGGTELAVTAGLFCLLHAGAVLALAALSRHVAQRLLAVAGLLLLGGTVLFSGDLAAAGLADWRPFPPAAPLGGGLLLAGWALVVGGALFGRGGALRSVDGAGRAA